MAPRAGASPCPGHLASKHLAVKACASPGHSLGAAAAVQPAGGVPGLVSRPFYEALAIVPGPCLHLWQKCSTPPMP